MTLDAVDAASRDGGIHTSAGLDAAINTGGVVLVTPDSVPSLANITVPYPVAALHDSVEVDMHTVIDRLLWSWPPVEVVMQTVNRTSINLSTLHIDFSNLSGSIPFRDAVANSLHIPLSDVSVQTAEKGQIVNIDVIWSPDVTQPTPEGIKTAPRAGLNKFVTQAREAFITDGHTETNSTMKAQLLSGALATTTHQAVTAA